MAIDFIKKTSFSINKVYSDGLYDAERIYKELWKKDAIPIIPIKKNVKYRRPSKPWLAYRDKQISEVNGLRGDDLARSRWKQLLGGALKSKKTENQIIEAKLKCHILNKMLLAK